MSRARLITWGLVAAGFVVGGVAGDRRFDRAYDPRTLCETCHDDGVELSAAAVPHSLDFGSICHACHVFGLEAYVTAGFDTVGLAPPAWADGLEDPVLAGQTCLGCHSRVARPEIDCAICHTDEARELIQVASCETCHVDKIPIAPHDGASCKQCHLETVASPRGMAKMLLQDNIRRREADRVDLRAGSTMGTKDADQFGPGAPP